LLIVKESVEIHAKSCMQEFDRSRFAEIIQARLKKRGWTGIRLAKEAAISQSQISRILNGKLKRFNPSHASICRIMHIGEKTLSSLTVDSNSSDVRQKIDRICAGKHERFAALGAILDQLLRLSQ
jgi:transcriptional regulator with XRE-family HTH domain